MSRVGAASVVLFNSEGNILLLQRSSQNKWKPGVWNLPGGKIDRGETPFEAATRECEEESGIVPRELTRVTTLSTHKGPMTVFQAYADTTFVILDHESQDWVWVSPEESMDYDLVPVADIAIEKVVENK